MNTICQACHMQETENDSAFCAECIYNGAGERLLPQDELDKTLAEIREQGGISFSSETWEEMCPDDYHHCGWCGERSAIYTAVGLECLDCGAIDLYIDGEGFNGRTPTCQQCGDPLQQGKCKPCDDAAMDDTNDVPF